MARRGGRPLPWREAPVSLRWRSATDRLYVGRGVYADGLRVEDASGRRLFDESRPSDAARVQATGWAPSGD
ncbi:hypothetical protein ACFQ60_08940 [Streptomyces zhihengii]